MRELLSDRHEPPLTLSPAAIERLRERVRRAAARKSGPQLLVSASSRVQLHAPLSDLLRGARLDGSPWALIQQPSNAGRGLLALGAATSLTVPGDGPRRLSSVARDWNQLASRALADPPGGVPGAGLVLIGGMAFAPGGGTAGTWTGFGAGDFVVPETSIAVDGDEAVLTVTLSVAPGDDASSGLAGAKLPSALLVPESAPPEDPFLEAPQTRSVLAASHFSEAVRRATAQIADGEFEKVVLARELEVVAAQPWDVPAVLERLSASFPDCFVFGVGRGTGSMVGASPELLLRREGQRAETVALAGSARRSDDPSVDEHLAAGLLQSTKDRHEHQLVVQRITGALRPASLWVTAQPQPQVISVANIHHLATPIRAQLRGHSGLLELVDELHPTPAVGGTPSVAALEAIPQLEGFDRGWYTGPIGWIDRAGDGEFFVGLRSGVIRGSVARLFAGVGVVGASDPHDELAETEVKLQAVLSALRPAH